MMTLDIRAYKNCECSHKLSQSDTLWLHLQFALINNLFSLNFTETMLMFLCILVLYLDQSAQLIQKFAHFYPDRTVAPPNPQNTKFNLFYFEGSYIN